MARTLLFALFGYLSGSLLFARYFGFLFAKKDISIDSADKNPGTFNALKNGGLLCGTATLICDLAKGFLPVYLYNSGLEIRGFGVALVMASAVVGHAFSFFHKFKGGKGIAVSFGSLLGLAPYIRPALVLAVIFVMFSIVIRITPHYHRTLLTYLLSAVTMPIATRSFAISAGFLLIAAVVTVKLLTSGEERGEMKVGLLWKS